MLTSLHRFKKRDGRGFKPRMHHSSDFFLFYISLGLKGTLHALQLEREMDSLHFANPSKVVSKSFFSGSKLPDWLTGKHQQ